MKLEKKHWIAIGVGVVIIAGVVIYTSKQKKKKLAAEQAEKDAKKLAESPIMAKAPEDLHISEDEEKTSTFPIAQGYSGYEVKVLQKYMNSTCKVSLDKAGVFPLKNDGVWGDKTEIAALACKSVKINSIDQKYYDRIHRDMSAAKILPEM